MLEIDNLFAGYGGAEILHGVSLRIEEGTLTGIIGPNGAGKSTLFKTVFGLLKPKRGKVSYRGEDITKLSPREKLMKGISYMPQDRAVFPYMTVKENLEMACFLRKEIEDRLEIVYSYFPFLKEKLNEKAKNLSGGQQRMLMIAGALLMQSDLILLDEPSIGLSPRLVDEIYSVIKELNKIEGKTFGIIEQNVGAIFANCDYVYVIEVGQKVLEGTPDELLKDNKIQDVYLGTFRS